MYDLNTTVFKSQTELTGALIELIRSAFTESAAFNQPRAVLLPGGSTPLAVYRALQEEPAEAPVSQWAILTDERYVPPGSNDLNFTHIQPFLESCGIPAERTIQVNTTLDADAAASNFEARLTEFLNEGGTIPLAITGLGADGHTAGLFNPEQIASAEDRLAIRVDRPDGRAGITATPRLIERAERIIFAVAGKDKQDAIHRLQHDPLSIASGLVVQNAKQVELWVDRDALGEPIN